MRFQRQLEEAAVYWEKSGEEEGNLWRRPNLDLLRDFHGRRGNEMTALQQRFLQASEKSEHRQRRLRRAGISGLVGLTVITCGVAVVAVHAAQRAEQQQQIALARQLAAQAG